MAGYCPVCQHELDDSLVCPNGASHPARLRTGGHRTIDLPKPSTRRRLAGASAEWLLYQVLCGFIVVLSNPLALGGLGDFIAALPLAVLIAVRDSHSGLFSIEKRISRMRVVKFSSGAPISNVEALKRNSYFLLMPLASLLPLFGFEAVLVGLFEVLVLIDVLMIAFREDGRRLGDLLAGTQVVHTVRREEDKA